MSLSRALAGLLVWVMLTVGSTQKVHAQAAWSLDVALDQSFTSLDPLPSPTGFAVTAGALRLWGPLGVQLSLRSVSEAGGVVDQTCGSMACTPGLYEVRHGMRTVGVGLSYDFVNPVDVWLTVVVGATANRQTERLKHLDTGEGLTLDSGETDLGLAVAAYLRPRPMVLGLRPEISVHYDRVFAGACVPDALCWPERDVFGVSAGFGWVLGPSGA